MIKNIFFDRDGVVNEVVFRDSKIESPRSIDEFKIKEDFREFYSKLSEMNLRMFIISNQPDIARKIMQQEELELMNDELKRVFKFEEIKYCIHDDSDNCTCRKPKPGMILNLIDKYNIEKNESILIGDSWKDIKAGQNAGIKTVLLSQNYNREVKVSPDYKVTSLMNLYNLINWSDE